MPRYLIKCWLCFQLLSLLTLIVMSDNGGGNIITSPTIEVADNVDEGRAASSTSSVVDYEDTPPMKADSLSAIEPPPPPENIQKLEVENAPSAVVEPAPPPVLPPTAATAAYEESELASLTKTAPDTVEVIAPSNLPGGYELKCMLSGEEFVVIVPPGGVEGGQSFVGKVQLNPLNIPRGRWRDGIFSCLSQGFLDPMCWLACFFELVVLGQVQTRESMSMFGGPGDPPKTSKTFVIMASIAVFIFVVNIILLAISGEQVSLYGTFSTIAGIFVLVVTMLTRISIRQKYKIPGSVPEDFFCACICTPCSICQMARHTYDYDKYPIKCCTNDCINKTGTSATAPIVI